MKKILLIALVLSCTSFSFTAMAQQDLKEEQKDIILKQGKPGKKEQQEIIIKTNGDKEIKLNIEIDGDKIMINGKPLVEFKDDGITINKRKMIFHHGDGNMNFDFEGLEGMKDMLGMQNEDFGKAQDEFMKAHREFAKTNKDFYHKPFLGVTTEKTIGGAKIVEVVKGSAAEKAGLKNEDVITKIGDKQVTDGKVLADIIAGKKPKDEIKIFYKREDKKKELKVVLGEKAESMDMNFKFTHPNAMLRSFKVPRMQINPIPDGNINFGPGENIFVDGFSRRKKLGLKIQDTEEGNTVKIIEVEDSSAAEKAGLKKDDIITDINGQKIHNTDDAREQLQEVAEKSAFPIKAKRNGTEMSFDIKIPKKLKTANL